MAKKKQLAGKETKLAKLPLTQALTGQAPERPPRSSSSPFPGPGLREVSRAREKSWEAAPFETLAAAYIKLVQDLAALRAALQPGAPASPDLPSHVPAPHRIRQVLNQATNDLRHLHQLLSQS